MLPSGDSTQVITESLSRAVEQLETTRANLKALSQLVSSE